MSRVFVGQREIFEAFHAMRIVNTSPSKHSTRTHDANNVVINPTTQETMAVAHSNTNSRRDYDVATVVANQHSGNAAIDPLTALCLDASTL
jgi:hypothetical protein